MRCCAKEASLNDSSYAAPCWRSRLRAGDPRPDALDLARWVFVIANDGSRTLEVRSDQVCDLVIDVMSDAERKIDRRPLARAPSVGELTREVVDQRTVIDMDLSVEILDPPPGAPAIAAPTPHNG
jgi:hypothetical protein